MIAQAARVGEQFLLSDDPSDLSRAPAPNGIFRLSFSPILKIGPYPTPGTPRSTSGLEPDIERFGSASGQDVPHVARIPAATTRCCHASVVESVGDLLQRGRSCLLHLLYDRQHRACEALGLGFTGLATATANGIEIWVAQLHTTCLGSCERRLGQAVGWLVPLTLSANAVYLGRIAAWAAAKLPH
jgi:hypothetical protein